MNDTRKTFGANSQLLSELLKDIGTGEIQLPDFQRGWVWDDNHIKSLIASVSLGYPVGALMTMETGGDGVRFAPRYFQGVNKIDREPAILVLDGQQRLTSLYLALFQDGAVETCDERNKRLDRFYYLDMPKCLDPEADRLDAVVSVSPSKQITSDFGRKVDLDISSRELEFTNLHFPLNMVFDPTKWSEWEAGFQKYFEYSPDKIKFMTQFRIEVLLPFQKYEVPVINLLRGTPKEAVCQVFENVNTGGVSLTVFELMTATYAAQNFRLRQDWDNRKNILDATDPVVKGVDEKDFLTAATLLSSYRKHISQGKAVSCKRKDVLNLELTEYQASADDLIEGLKRAARFLHAQKIFDTRNLPYQTQLIPLGVICAHLGPRFEDHTVRTKLARWYWCGVLGELYGGANETRYALDVLGVPAWIDGGSDPTSVRDSNFSPTRLLSLRTRNSAAYKGITALLMDKGSQDLINGDPIHVTNYFDEAVDIHHIFPANYCQSQGYDRDVWNSIVNKAALTSRTNRILGGKAPSNYINRILANHNVDEDDLDKHLKTHLVSPQLLKSDEYDDFILDRSKKLLNLIEKAMGKAVVGRDSEETINAFGEALV